MTTKYSIYGIKIDTPIIKLMEILDKFEIPYEFFDFRDFPPEEEQLRKWGDFQQEEWPINGRSTLFKKKERIFLKLTKNEKVLWLQKHYHVLERPIIENDQGEVLSIGGRQERIAKVVFNLELM